MSNSRPEVYVGLAGPSNSGKSNLLYDLCTCINQKLHGYPARMNINLAPYGDTQQTEKTYRRKLPEATNACSTLSFALSYFPSDTFPENLNPSSDCGTTQSGDIAQQKTRGEKNILLKVQDAPGEKTFPLKSIENSGAKNYIPDGREDDGSSVENSFAQSAGIVLVVSAIKAGSPDGFLNFSHEIEKYISKKNKNIYNNLERVVIAISMFDLLCLKFGSRALPIACDPKSTLLLLQSHLKPVEDCIFDLIRGSRDLDIRFIATSSYGFHPRFGCPNVDISSHLISSDAEMDNFFPLARDVLRYPFMTADPFIYAATGESNDYFYSAEQIKNSKF